ncbi:MAG: MFS transporter [Hyphomicrobiaceae bacterium]
MLATRATDILKRQSTALMMALGHGATHWILATVYVILPFLGQDLGLSFAQIGSLISLFHAASFVANAGSGAVVDITGRYLTAACLSLVFGAAALVAFGLAGNIMVLVAAIVVIGVTNNLWHPAAISLLSHTYPAARGLALSVHTLGATMGDILAPVCAGALMLTMTWQATAVLNAVPVFLVAAIIAVLGRNLATNGGDARPRLSKDLSYLGALRGLASNRAVVLLCSMAGFRSMTQNGLLLFLPLYLVNELQAGPLLVGTAMTGIQAGAIVSGPIAGAVSDRVGRKPVVLIGLAATAIVLGAMNAIVQVETFIALACALGLVMFAVRPVIHGWVLDLASDRLSGSVVSLLFATQSAFTMLVPLVGGLVADHWGLATTFYLMTATIVIAVVMAAAVPDRHLVEDHGS